MPLVLQALLAWFAASAVVGSVVGTLLASDRRPAPLAAPSVPPNHAVPA